MLRHFVNLTSNFYQQILIKRLHLHSHSEEGSTTQSHSKLPELLLQFYSLLISRIVLMSRSVENSVHVNLLARADIAAMECLELLVVCYQYFILINDHDS